MGLASSSTTLLDYEELIAQTSYPLETCYSPNSLATVRSSAFRRSHLHIRLEFRLQAVSFTHPFGVPPSGGLACRTASRKPH
jgi:hypothetical protein